MRRAVTVLALVLALGLLLDACKAPPPPSVKNKNRGGPPDTSRSITICSYSIRQFNGMILDKTMEPDSFTIRGMKCTIELTRNEMESTYIVVRKTESGLFFGTMFQPRNPPDFYHTAYRITFSYPGFKDVVFRKIPIVNRRIEVPEVVFVRAGKL
jgi:hypothetical protein